MISRKHLSGIWRSGERSGVEIYLGVRITMVFEATKLYEIYKRMAKRNRQGSRMKLEALKHSEVIEKARNQQRRLRRKHRGQTR